MDAEQVARQILLRFKAADKKSGELLMAGAIGMALKRQSPRGLGLANREIDAGRDFAVDKGWIVVGKDGATWRLTETGAEV